MLQKGSKGAEVTELQTALRLLGFGDVIADGKFGPVTDRAVRAFQGGHALTVDGKVGPETEAAIIAALQPKTPPAAAPAPAPTTPAFDADGWYHSARRCPMHELRVGPEITVRGAVVHTTDMRPGSMPALVKSWCTKPGERNGATFLIGRAPGVDGEEWPTGGVVQFAPVNRNTGHAGGPNGSHGWVTYPGGKLHPNSCYVGIELDGAGRLEKLVTKYGHPSSGAVIEPEDVFVDERGKPWHVLTEYQLEQLGRLLDAIRTIAHPFPTGAAITSNGMYQRNGVPWGALSTIDYVGHVTLDPNRKTDPGPQGIDWLRRRVALG